MQCSPVSRATYDSVELAVRLVVPETSLVQLSFSDLIELHKILADLLTGVQRPDTGVKDPEKNPSTGDERPLASANVTIEVLPEANASVSSLSVIAPQRQLWSKIISYERQLRLLCVTDDDVHRWVLQRMVQKTRGLIPGLSSLGYFFVWLAVLNTIAIPGFIIHSPAALFVWPRSFPIKCCVSSHIFPQISRTTELLVRVEKNRAGLMTTYKVDIEEKTL